MTRANPRLPRWQRLVLYLSGAPLLLSGVGWLALHYSVGAGAGELPHPLEPWAMRLHGLAAFAALFVLGTLAGMHIPQGWRASSRHRWASQRGSGVAMCALAAFVVATGYLLYYFAPEWLRPAMGWLHALVGLALGGVLLVHRKARLRHLHARP